MTEEILIALAVIQLAALGWLLSQWLEQKQAIARLKAGQEDLEEAWQKRLEQGLEAQESKQAVLLQKQEKKIEKRARKERKAAQAHLRKALKEQAGDNIQRSLEYAALGLGDVLFKPVSVVLSMPKTASSSLTACCDQLPFSGKVYHYHRLSEAKLEKPASKEGSEQYKSRYNAIRECRFQILLRQLLHEESHAYRQQVGKIYFLTGVRDPVEQNIAQLFHGYSIKSTLDVDMIDHDLLKKQFLEGSLPWPADFWFGQEHTPLSGINIFEKPFKRERGWSVYARGPARALVIRQDRMAGLKEALTELYEREIEDSWVVSTNRSEGKTYKEQYEAFKQSFKLPDNILDKTYSNPGLKHFYTEEELSEMRERWRS